jgi:hypothetical protein
VCSVRDNAGGFQLDNRIRIRPGSRAPRQQPLPTLPGDVGEAKAVDEGTAAVPQTSLRQATRGAQKTLDYATTYIEAAQEAGEVKVCHAL